MSDAVQVEIKLPLGSLELIKFGQWLGEAVEGGRMQGSPLTQIDIKLPLSSQVVVSDWLTETAGMRRTFANGVDVSGIEIAVTAHQCEWAEIRPVSGQDGIYPKALHMGWGDRTLAYTQPPSEAAGAYFFVAVKCPDNI